MRKIFLFLFIIFISTGAKIAMSSCSSQQNIHMDASGIPHCYLSDIRAKYWCLSRPENNNGSNTNWLAWNERMWSCYFKGDWSDQGVRGCCGMGDAPYNSKTSIAIVEYAEYENSIDHHGRYFATIAERGSNGFDFPGGEFNIIPSFKILNVQSNGPNGNTTITLSGWGLWKGPAHYRIRLQDGKIADDHVLNDICSPYGRSPCPSPIIGYRIRAITAPCADENCLLPLPPVTSLASAWTINVENDRILGRNPSFPMNNIKITNPEECNDNNRFLYVATQIEYADGILSSFVSHNSISIDWCAKKPEEAIKDYIKLELDVAPTTITCEDDVEITIRLLNSSKDKSFIFYSSWIIPAIDVAILAYDAINRSQLTGNIDYFKLGNGFMDNKVKLFPNEFIGRSFLYRLHNGIFSLQSPRYIDSYPEILNYEVGEKDFILQAWYHLRIPYHGEVKLLKSKEVLITNSCKIN